MLLGSETKPGRNMDFRGLGSRGLGFRGLADIGGFLSLGFEWDLQFGGITSTVLGVTSLTAWELFQNHQHVQGPKILFEVFAVLCILGQNSFG